MGVGIGAFSIAEGAVDCIVVKVVVRDSDEFCGEEKVLLRPSYVAPPVLEVPVFDCTSEYIVSALVANVGAADLLLLIGTLPLLAESSYDVKLPTRGDVGPYEDAPAPLRTLGGAAGLCRWLDSGYGLFLTFQCFLARERL